jgi:hypothetical protein
MPGCRGTSGRGARQCNDAEAWLHAWERESTSGGLPTTGDYWTIGSAWIAEQRAQRRSKPRSVCCPRSSRSRTAPSSRSARMASDGGRRTVHAPGSYAQALEPFKPKAKAKPRPIDALASFAILDAGERRDPQRPDRPVIHRRARPEAPVGTAFVQARALDGGPSDRATFRNLGPARLGHP